MNSSPTTYFWYDAWIREVLLKDFIPEDIWNNMSDKYCTVQQAFNNPMSFQLQTATRSDTADQVWSELSHLLHFNNREVSVVTDGVTAFLACPEIMATSGRLIRCTFMAALWEIWCSRNKARFQDQGMTAKHIINRTMLSIRAICISFKFQKVPQPWLAALRQTEHGMEELKSRTPTIVRWITPPSGRLKLNVDGAFMRTSGTVGGGGILRDHEGNMCWAFARAYHDLNSSLAAEAMALNDGLSICSSKGVSEVLVETDSLNLLQLVTNQISSQWDLTCIMHDIAVKTLNLKAEIAHVPREANRVADCLASWEVCGQVWGVCGLAGWAQDTSSFTVCECDKERHRALNVTVLHVAFLLPLRGGCRLHVRRVSHTGRPMDISLKKVTPSSVATWSRRRGLSHSKT
ncbi:hypothetical protein Taro_044603 [Colocasia esculenta]|uniref:RNase H type-1 domain-containing protein n=1 Tax=Colocasia esculenta TaxID=4460 RepID=A0A843X3J4_COLES|nr:hypothetical protein [Colocasia esculenta]